MGYYSDNTLAYEGHDTLLTLKQLIAGEGGNHTHEALFTYMIGHTFGPRYKDRRAGQAFLLLAPPVMRVLGAWDSYHWEVEYVNRIGIPIEPTVPMEVISMLNAIDGVQLSPYLLSIAGRGLEARDRIHLDTTKLQESPIWLTYSDIARRDDRSLSIEYITRELGYSTHASTAIHNLIVGNLYV